MNSVFRFVSAVSLMPFAAGAIMAQAASTRATPQEAPELQGASRTNVQVVEKPSTSSNGAIAPIATQNITNISQADRGGTQASPASEKTSAQVTENTGPRAENLRAGFSVKSEAPAKADLPAVAPPPRAGQSVALMVVGGAALIIGAVVGGDGGTLLAIGGAVVGLVGLYQFVK